MSIGARMRDCRWCCRDQTVRVGIIGLWVDTFHPDAESPQTCDPSCHAHQSGSPAALLRNQITLRIITHISPAMGTPRGISGNARQNIIFMLAHSGDICGLRQHTSGQARETQRHAGAALNCRLHRGRSDIELVILRAVNRIDVSHPASTPSASATLPLRYSSGCREPCSHWLII